MEQFNEVAFNIVDWDRDADLGADNIHHNMRQFFVSRNYGLPQSIVVRPDQAHTLMRDFKTYPPEDMYGFNKIEIPGVGLFTLIIVVREYKR